MKSIGTISWYSSKNMIGGSESFWDQFPAFFKDYEWNTIDYKKAATALAVPMEPRNYGFFEIEGGFIIDDYINSMKIGKPDLLIRNSWTGGYIDTGVPQISVYQDVHHTAAEILYPEHYNMVEYHRIKHCFTIAQQINAKNSVANIAVSNFTRDMMKEIGIECEVIEHGIDMNVFKPQETTPRERKRVLYVGRFHPQKGWHILIELAKRNPNVDFWVMSMSKINYKPTLPNIVPLKPTSRADMVRIYNEVDITLVPSCCESFGLASLESCACDTPILTCPTGVWYDYMPCCIGEFAMWDADDFDEKLKYMLGRLDKYSPRKKVVDKFSIEKWKEKWSALLHKHLHSSA